MDSNYPIVQLTTGTGTVEYATTSNWTPGVQTGTTPVTTQFNMPTGAGPGAYLLNVAASGISSTNTLFLDMGSGANNLTVEVNPSNSSQDLVLENGSTIGTFNNTSFTQILAVGDSGNDILTINDANGNPIPSGGLNYSGGGGTDGLVVQGTTAQSVTYTPSGSTDGGGVVVAAGGNIEFGGLTAIDVTGYGTATMTYANAGDTVNVAAGSDFNSGGSPAALDVSGNSAGVGFAPAAFWSDTNLVLNTAANPGTDAVTVTSANNSNGITNFTVTEPTGNSGTVTVNGAATFSGAVSLTAANVNSVAAGTISTGTGLTIDISGSASTLAGVVAGAGGLTLQSGGTLSLGGTNTYTGTTTLAAGTLLVNGNDSAANGAVAVNGGILGGTGTIGGTVTVNSGGTITGGKLGTVGTLTVGALTFKGGTYAVDFNGNSSDSLATSGAINLNGGAAGIFSINSQTGLASTTNIFTLINNTGSGTIANPPLSGARKMERVPSMVNTGTSRISVVRGTVSPLPDPLTSH